MRDLEEASVVNELKVQHSKNTTTAATNTDNAKDVDSVRDDLIVINRAARLHKEMSDFRATHQPRRYRYEASDVPVYTLSYDIMQKRADFLESVINFADFLFAINRSFLYEQLYALTWLKFIAKILTQFKLTALSFDEFFLISKMTIDNVSVNLTAAFVKDLLKLPTIREMRLGSMESWAVPYWDFLHRSSFVVQTDPILRREFGLLLINFDILIPCNICSYHFRVKNSIANIYVPIIETGDCVGTIYRFHNEVNRTALKQTYFDVTGKSGRSIITTDFPIELFCQRYECKLKDTTTVKYRHVIEY